MPEDRFNLTELNVDELEDDAINGERGLEEICARFSE